VRATNIFTIENIPYFANQIHWDYDFNADGKVDSTLIADEWVGTAGILERKFIAKVVISTPYYPEGIGTADYVDDYLCTSLSVK
jgi:hypothetical protein